MTEPQTWTVIGGLMSFGVVSLGLVLRVVRAEVGGVRSEVHAVNMRIDGMEDQMNARFDAVDTRFDSTDGRIDLLDRDVQRLVDQHFRES